MKNKNTSLKKQKMLIGFCAFATVATLIHASFKTETKSKIAATAGAMLASCGLGGAIEGYLSNSHRKKERD